MRRPIIYIFNILLEHKVCHDVGVEILLEHKVCHDVGVEAVATVANLRITHNTHNNAVVKRQKT